MKLGPLEGLQIERRLVTNLSDWEKPFTEWKSPQELGFDIETTGFDVHNKNIVGFSLGAEKVTGGYLGIYVPLAHQKGPNFPIWEISGPLIELFQTTRLIGHNIKFDLGFMLHKFSLSPHRSVGDSYLMANLLQYQSLGLKDLANKFGFFDTMDFPELFATKDMFGNVELPNKKAELDFSTLPSDREDVIKYAATDAVLSHVLEKLLLDKIHDDGVLRTYTRECNLSMALAATESRGFLMDQTLVKELHTQYGVKLKKIEKEFFEIAGYEFAINSPKKLAKVLYEDMQFEPQEFTPSGAPSTAAGAVDRLIHENPTNRFLLLLKHQKHYFTLVNRFFDKIQDHVQLDGRVHCSYNQMGFDGTARTYSRDPNVEQLPWPLRAAIKPEPGHYFVMADYSAAELRVAAAMSQEPKLIKAFQDGVDVHVATYVEMTEADPTSVTKDQRNIGKILNYAIMYGASQFRVSKLLHVEGDEATKLMKLHRAALPVLYQWVDQLGQGVLKNSYVTNIFGRRWQIKEAFAKKRKEQEHAKRRAVNNTMQFTVADMAKEAIIKAWNGGLQVIAQVHDSILFQFPDTVEIHQAESAVRSVMETTIEGVYFPVEIGHSAKSWAHCHSEDPFIELTEEV